MPSPGAPLMGCTAPPPSSSVPWYFPFEPLDTTVQSGFSSHTCRAKCLRGLFADPVNSEEHQTGFLQALQKVPVPSKGVLQKRDSPQSFLPPMHAAYITWGMQRGVESRTCSGACLVRPNPSVEHPALTLCLLPHSQAEFQQCGCLLGQHNSQWGGWCGADSHQGVSEVPHHIPAHTAACSRPRLQACSGE